MAPPPIPIVALNIDALGSEKLDTTIVAAATGADFALIIRVEVSTPPPATELRYAPQPVRPFPNFHNRDADELDDAALDNNDGEDGSLLLPLPPADPSIDIPAVPATEQYLLTRPLDRGLGGRVDGPAFDVDHDRSTHDLDKGPASDPSLTVPTPTAMHSSSLDSHSIASSVATSFVNVDSLAPQDAMRPAATTDFRLSMNVSATDRSIVQAGSSADPVATSGDQAADTISPGALTPVANAQPVSVKDLASIAAPSINATDVVSHLTSLDPKSIEESINRLLARLEPGHGRSCLSLRRLGLFGAGLVIGIVGFEINRRHRFAQRLTRLLRRNKQPAAGERAPRPRAES
jgi:hypothetical protein